MIDIYPADETNTTGSQRSRVADIAWNHGLDAAQLLSQFTATSRFAGRIECDLNGTRYHVYPDGLLATRPTPCSASPVEAPHAALGSEGD